ncbi:MAG: thermonuclease family protein [Candidatus Parcubacteria bacterium]|nr:thermonuclease family protein [Candidatus Parcubacteria bacterium]
MFLKKIPIVLALILCLCLAPNSQSPTDAQIFKVTRIVDGDTFVLETKDKVRLLGVDTPELHHPKKPVQCFAQEAKDFTSRQVLNQKVKLTFEGQPRDRYGRVLAWIWYGPGYKKLLNAEIISQGYGFSYRKYPTSRLEEFNRLEREARKNKRGLWADNACTNFQP